MPIIQPAMMSIVYGDHASHPAARPRDPVRRWHTVSGNPAQETRSGITTRVKTRRSEAIALVELRQDRRSLPRIPDKAVSIAQRESVVRVNHDTAR